MRTTADQAEIGPVGEWQAHPPITGERHAPENYRRKRSGSWRCGWCGKHVPYADEHCSAEDGGCCETYRSDPDRDPRVSVSWLRHLTNRGNPEGPNYCVPPESVGMTKADDGVWEYHGRVPGRNASTKE